MIGNLFNQKKQDDAKNDMSSSSSSVSDNPQAQNQVAQSRMNPALKQDFSALSHLDTRSSQVVKHATDETKRIKQQHVMSEQLLYGLLYDEELFKIFEQLGVDPAKLTRDIQASEVQGGFVGQTTLHGEVMKIFEQSYAHAKGRGVSFIMPEDLLLVLVSSDTKAAKLLEANGLKKDDLQKHLSKNTDFMAAKKSIVEKYGIDLTQMARDGKIDPIAGRDKEIERLIHILLRRTKNNPILIGEPGVGKTAVVEGLAIKIVENTVPVQLQNHRIMQLDLAALVAGASHRGEFEERLKGVIQECVASNGGIILFIDEIHTVIGAGDMEGTMDASNIIKPYLARGQMQIIGTTTTAEYRKHFEKDKAFQRRFQQIICDEPDEETAVKMLQVLKGKYEKFHGVSLPDDSLIAAVKLSKKYIGERYLPDKAVDLIDEASAQVKLQTQAGNGSGGSVSKSDIEKVVSSWTGIPITKLTEDESAKLLKLEDRIHERLIDQEEAVVAVSEAVRRGRIGLAAANRPIASFIFLGPTGVGKTELAKTLAEILFGKEDALVRLDMSEYMEKHEVAKLIGAPPGYVGYEEGGQLTEAVRNKPYSIVLLDEVEKAHPDVFNILLQLLEDGRLTDNKGNTISFKNTIIIATSNIGSALIQQKLGQQAVSSDANKQQEQFNELANMISDELHKFFRPELLNRFDELVIFKPLLPQHMQQVAKLGISKTAKLLKEQGFGIQVSDKCISKLAEDGYDPMYGARPLRRLIQTAIENPIALQIIGKNFSQNDVIVVDYDDSKNDYVFSKGNLSEAPAQNLQNTQQEDTATTNESNVKGSEASQQAAVSEQQSVQPEIQVQNPYDFSSQTQAQGGDSSGMIADNPSPDQSSGQVANPFDSTPSSGSQGLQSTENLPS